ncbi:MAG TPA: outer membrane beta-barrel protein [Mucilaginibacter sp.]|nr:outer membrane beta-barrel protein [Mucilaginibacter sp.]
MRFKLILSALCLLSIQAFSQSKNNISVVYGFASNTIDIHGAIGDYGYANKSGIMYGLSYTRDLAKSFSIETGLIYANHQAEVHYIVGGLGEQKRSGEIHLISVPLYARYTFLKYLFLQGGFSLDHQTNYTRESVANDQSGLGLEFGVGGKINLGQFSVFANPYFCNHNFSGTNNLMETGVKFGAGFNF